MDPLRRPAAPGVIEDMEAATIQLMSAVDDDSSGERIHEFLKLLAPDRPGL